jgi:hypothetical protein
MSCCDSEDILYRLCDPLQLCAHLGFRLNMGRTHDHAIGTRVEERPHDIFRRLLPVDGNGNQFWIAASKRNKPHSGARKIRELLLRRFAGRPTPAGQKHDPCRPRSSRQVIDIGHKQR